MGRERYRRNRSGEGHALVEVRAARIAGRASDEEYADAMREMFDTGRVPRGWLVQTVEWAHHRSGAVSEMVEGDVVNLNDFAIVGLSPDASIGVVDDSATIDTVTVQRPVLREEIVLTGNERWRADGEHGIPRGQFVKPEYADEHPDAIYLDQKTRSRLQVEQYWEMEDVEVEIEWIVIRMEYDR